MNQDQVKATLLAVAGAPMDFSIIFSGKKSRKVNGLYKPDVREIIIHNHNFSDDRENTDNLLLYTAIHEYAHHLHACSRGGTLSSRTHTTEFWAIFHDLLEKAEAKGLYKNVFANAPELEALTETIRRRYLQENGALFKELGMHLLKAHEICIKIGARFEDYLDRMLRIPRTAATMAVRTYRYGLDPRLGADNMRFLASIGNEESRTKAEQALLTGKSPDSVKIAVRRGRREEDPRERLEKEKDRLERTIGALHKRLAQIEQELGKR